MKITSLGFLLPVITLGCAIDAEEAPGGPQGERVGAAESAAVHNNAIFANAIFANSLAPQSLPSAQMTDLVDAGEAGELSRMLMRYLVHCAFDGSQAFTFSWEDSDYVLHHETYVGGVGLATGWETRGLYETEQRWVSACIAARVNYYGATVSLSLRGDHAALATTPAEQEVYPHQEGAFWGNIFLPEPYLNACYNTANVEHSRSKMRDCAAGHWDGATVSDCGDLQRVGPCDVVCVDRTSPPDVPDDGFASCNGVTEVITTFLDD